MNNVPQNYLLTGYFVYQRASLEMQFIVLFLSVIFKRIKKCATNQIYIYIYDVFATNITLKLNVTCNRDIRWLRVNEISRKPAVTYRVKVAIITSLFPFFDDTSGDVHPLNHLLLRRSKTCKYNVIVSSLTEQIAQRVHVFSVLRRRLTISVTSIDKERWRTRLSALVSYFRYRQTRTLCAKDIYGSKYRKRSTCARNEY